MSPPFPKVVHGRLLLDGRLHLLLLSAIALVNVQSSRPSAVEGVAVGAAGHFQLASEQAHRGALLQSTSTKSDEDEDGLSTLGKIKDSAALAAAVVQFAKKVAEVAPEKDPDCDFDKIKGADVPKQRTMLPQLQLCLDNIGRARETAVGQAKVSARMNTALFKQYRKLVDLATVLDAQGGPNQPLNQEQAEAMDRVHEAESISEDINESNKWRRQLWLPSWKAKGLWPTNFIPDPRRVLGDQRLPYLGGQPKKMNSVDFIMSSLDSAQAVKMQKWMKNDEKRYARIQDLRKRLLSGAKMQPDDLRELAALEQEDANKFDPDKFKEAKAEFDTPKFKVPDGTARELRAADNSQEDDSLTAPEAYPLDE